MTAETRPPRRHIIVTHQGHKPATTGRKHARRNQRQSRGCEGREGSPQRTKGGGIQGTPAILIIFTNFCFSHNRIPLRQTSKTRPSGRVLVFSGLSYLLDQTRQTRLFFWRVRRVWSSSSSHLTPSPPPPLQIRCRCPKGHLQRISFTTHDEHARFGVSVVFSCVCYISSLSEHQRAHFGHIGGLRQVFHSQTQRNVPYGMFLRVQLHSLHIRTPLTYPFGYISGVRLLVFHPNPSL